MNTKMSHELAPVTQRIELLDVIRGFALVGILFANILSWSGIKFLHFDVIESFGNIENDRMLYGFLKYFVDTKFYTIFSLLFGIGFSLQISKNMDNPAFPPLYARRLSWLIIIGLTHALLWSGDILILYALMGFILLAIRKISQPMQLKLALIMFATPLVLDIIYMYTFASTIPEITPTALKMYPDTSPDEVVAGFQSMNFVAVFKMNLHNLIWRWYDFIPSGRPFKVLGLFLLGSYLYRSGYFTEKVRKIKILTVWLVLGFGLTYLAMALKGGVSNYSKSWSDILYKLIHEVGQISLSLSYISIIAIVLNKFPKLFIWDAFKAYGRMSLTSYIGQSILGIFVFYPIIGLDYYGSLSLEKVYYFGLAILVIQIAFSMIWFRWFKFGPIEWAWRCVTYQKLFPILKK